MIKYLFLIYIIVKLVYLKKYGYKTKNNMKGWPKTNPTLNLDWF
jgi:hypothetical protein